MTVYYIQNGRFRGANDLTLVSTTGVPSSVSALYVGFVVDETKSG